MQRGDIFTAATGSGFGSKPRPVLILQGDGYVPAPHVIVALIASPIDNPPSLRVPVRATAANGLDHDSLVEVDVLVTVRHDQFGRCCGKMEPSVMEQVDRALLALLGFA